MHYKNSNCPIGLKIAVMAFATLTTVNSHAEIFGSMTGRTAEYSAQPQLSLEATITNGEVFGSDFQQLGMRVNYKHTSRILVFGDIGKSELASESEVSFGLGAFYSLEQSLLGINTAVKVSFHQANFGSGSIGSGGLVQQCRPHTSTVDGLPELTTICHAVPRDSGGGSSSSNFTNIALELHTSGAIPGSALGANTQWYVNGGIQSVRGGGQNDIIPGVGAGIVLPLDKHEVFAGVEYADEIFLGAGFRYLVR